jgi:hypothetical protein
MAVKGLGRTETCIEHPDRPAAARCAACHRPVCSSCVVTTADGKFCSHTCADKTSDYRKRAKKIKAPGGGGIAKLVRLVVWIVVIIVILGVVNRFAMKGRMPVVGSFLNRLPVIGAPAAR